MRRRPARVGSDNVDAERLPVVIELSGVGMAPVVLERFEDGDAALVYSPGWRSVVDSGRSGGGATLTNSAGALVEVEFEGTVVRWIATKN
jgi:hypothetical protein